MLRQQLRIVDAGIGDIGAASFSASAAASIGPKDRLHEGVGVGAALHPLTLVAKSGSAASAASPITFSCQHAPFAIVLDRNQDVGAVARS